MEGFLHCVQLCSWNPVWGLGFCCCVSLTPWFSFPLWFISFKTSLLRIRLSKYLPLQCFSEHLWVSFHVATLVKYEFLVIKSAYGVKIPLGIANFFFSKVVPEANGSDYFSRPPHWCWRYSTVLNQMCENFNGFYCLLAKNLFDN